MNLFGWELNRNKGSQQPVLDTSSFVTPTNTDGAVTVTAAGGVQAYAIDVDGTVKSEAELIQRYRDLALQPEVSECIDDIVDESIITDDPLKPAVTLSLDGLEISDKLKQIINEEFEHIVSLYKFNVRGAGIFRSWYTDGRKYYDTIIDEEHPENGIQELREIDSLKIRKVREVVKVPDPETGGFVQGIANEYYLYNDLGFNTIAGNVSNINPAGTIQNIKISKDRIIHVTSGVFNENNTMVLSCLHPAIKPMNQLRMLEDAVVVYQLVRAPQRRAFYIDVGGLPRGKADQYLNEMMVKHKNRLVYDQTTGQIKDDRKFTTLLEDYWLPRRDGKGTEISTLQEGGNLTDQLENVNYFLQKLYKSLKVPITRIDAGGAFNLGRSSEITRDEVKFMKFIGRLRVQFSGLFLKALEKQLILRRIIAAEEWPYILSGMKVVYASDNLFEELKAAEILRERAATTAALQPLIGVLFSEKWVAEKIWQMTEEEILEQQKQIEEEESFLPADTRKGRAPGEGQ